MVRWPGLPLVLLFTSAVAADADRDRQGITLQATRPVLISSAEAEPARQIATLQLQIQAVDERLKKMELLLQNNAALDILREVEAMKVEVFRLRGQSELQMHKMETLEKRQTDLYTDLDKRLEDLNKQVKIAASPAPAPPLALVASTQVAVPPPPAPSPATVASPTQVPVAPSPPAEDPLVESKNYETALNQFKSGNYVAAIAGFKNFLKAFPGSTLAPNAQYWIGYSYYALKDYKTALSQQQKLIGSYPQSAKVPDALLNIASCQTELDDVGTAKKTLEEIVAKHSRSNAAKIAARRLSALN